MFPRNPLAIWHKSAQGNSLRVLGFAIFKGVCHALDMAGCPYTMVKSHDCYPSPFMQPDPAGVGLFFSPRQGEAARSLADSGMQRRFGFSISAGLLKSGSIKTTFGGRARCVFPRSLPLLSLPPALLAACKPIPSVRLLALVPALLRQKPLVATPVMLCLRVLRAALLARFATTQAFATDLTAAVRGKPPELKAIQAERLGGLFTFAPLPVDQRVGQP